MVTKMVNTRANQTLPKTMVATRPRIEEWVVPDEETFIARDRRTCDCALTYVHRKRHGALGVGIEIRLCCLAKKMEELAGLPPGTFFFAMDFKPTWKWDCNAMQKRHVRQSDGSIVEEETRLGNPPRWLRERMEKKNIKIRNL
ncbi:hypothetical protein LCGC14_1436200 [marine sediment metagenome]|uniref:Uncharacterized protein n=1 Tax=marine sediment metagenome TaxID=412755 RepID=A0A0F9M2M9_9ZZZZ